ncbi:MAG: hypothetical protein DME17_14075 [Candidatus Rokuibacteriota bacterium]|nr:MAG: hypothetical protein DME17_14075 [Candidatus Rokubacteria bacterium]
MALTTGSPRRAVRLRTVVAPDAAPEPDRVGPGPGGGRRRSRRRPTPWPPLAEAGSPFGA